MRRARRSGAGPHGSAPVLRAGLHLHRARCASPRPVRPSHRGRTIPGCTGPAWRSWWCAQLSVFLPWQRLPRWAILVPTIGYLVSVTLLLISGGTDPSMQSTAGGLSALVLLPVLAMALYYPSSYTAIVVCAATRQPDRGRCRRAEQRGDGPAAPLLVDRGGRGRRGDRAPSPQQPRGEGAGLGRARPPWPPHERDAPNP